MAIQSTDIAWRLTTKNGSAGDTTASTPDASLGKYASTTTFAAGSNSLFDDVKGSENAAHGVDYRAFYVYNGHPTLTLKDAVVFMTQTGGGTDIAIAVDNTAASALGSTPAQGTSIASETTAPSGVGAFSSPGNAADGLLLGDLAPGVGRMVWVRRTANDTPAQADGAQFFVTGDTDA